MNKTIFTKYSNDRSEQFNIRTDICQDIMGNRHVVKYAIGEAAQEHVNRMFASCRRLEQIYRGTRMEPNRCRPVEGGMEFEYITGPTLEEVLDACLDREDIAGFQAIVREYAGLIRSHMVKDFCDIDMIFSNIMVVGDRWIICDYEWCMEEELPADYVLYRTVLYYLTPQRQEQMGTLNMYDLMGIAENKIATYEKMEKVLQDYVIEGNRPLWSLYEDMGRKIYMPAGLVEQEKVYQEIIRYAADGQYTSETMAVQPDEDGHIRIRVKLDAEVETLRIDPANRPCLLRIVKMEGICGDGADSGRKPVAYGTNGVSKDNVEISFNTADPQILIGNPQNGIQYVEMDYVLSYVQADLLASIQQSAEDFNALRCDNQQKTARADQLEQQKRQLEALCQDTQNKLNQTTTTLVQMTESRSWKITRPLRLLKKFMK